MWGLRVVAAIASIESGMFPTHVGIARPEPGGVRPRRHVPYACGDCAGPRNRHRAEQACSLRMWGLRGTPARPLAPSAMFPTHVGIARPRSLAGQAGQDVPYACGDCALPAVAYSTASQCSLRMWGLRDNNNRDRPGQRMFPTHVGIARRIRGEDRGGRDVPYACGDCARYVLPPMLTLRCSLRMWGLRGDRLDHRHAHGMFPTHVGIARASHGIDSAWNHVPYACGDCAQFRTAPVAGQQCSLRMWGLRDARHPPRGVHAMFPTHVGIALQQHQQDGGRCDVPYACGDCASTAWCISGATRCSLRMWGLRDGMPTMPTRNGMFPTHVGIARIRNAARIAKHNVPYACGDCAEPASGIEGGAGCSLRMWGLRGASGSSWACPRMFPTHVGIARIVNASDETPRDVPYACGDCAPLLAPHQYVFGCSLRMWGLRVGQAQGVPHPGMFPTHVGIARRVLCPTADGRHVPYACGDCAEGRSGACPALPCSLRMWGLRGGSFRRLPCPAMFPTHVGIARRLSFPRLGVPYVPYACGDCARSMSSGVSIGACSLRMWGLRAPVATRTVAYGMFPTHVGIARACRATWHAVGNVPYACGDCAPTDAVCAAPPRCSLRMWGLRVQRQAHRQAIRMFPTHVGIALFLDAADHGQAHVPYACGDCAIALDVGGFHAKCSLRMWGLRAQIGRHAPRGAMFPTHVGIARRGAVAYAPRHYVPYACGDCANSAGNSSWRVICSLRMWGLRVITALRSRIEGMFPTHVGIARKEPSRWRRIWECSLRMWGLRAKHSRHFQRYYMFPTHVGIARCCVSAKKAAVYVPYACGDCAYSWRVTSPTLVCSLRMWGLRAFRALGRMSPMMFPTHVGIARIRGTTALRAWHVPYACGDCADLRYETAVTEKCSLRMWGLRDYGDCRSAPYSMFPTHVGIARSTAALGGSAGHVPYACGDCAPTVHDEDGMP